MKSKMFMVALLTTGMFTTAGAAYAQGTDADIKVETQAPQSNEDLAARAAFLEATVAAQQEQIDELKALVTKVSASPSWKGAPQFLDKDAGWSFKPRGRLQFDAGLVGHPDGVTDRSLGFTNEVRRARLGVEGTVPGGFGYKFEVDFADGNVEFADALLSYDFMPGAGLIIGNHNNFQSLEELTSSRFLSFMERAAFTDAFNFERRLGISVGFSSGAFMANVGVFSDGVGDLVNDDNNSVSIDGRAVFFPKLGSTQLHLGGSAHFRNNKDLVDIGTMTRYRQRPFIHTTDTRFLATPNLAVEKETSYGFEAAVIHGPFHAVGEVHWLRANRVDPAPTAKFFGGYAEVGYYLTGETRGYKSGVFDRTKVSNPVDKGGVGAFQVNLRYDYLDLNSVGILGGKQRGYEASLIWIPQDHVRFLLNLGRMVYRDSAVPAAGGDRDYGITVAGARAQIDF